MRTVPTRSWRGISAEDRRAERRAALIEAGLEVIGTQGWAGTTVRGVCRQAGLTERYFYESFADHEALLLAVYDHTLATGIEYVLAAVRSAPADLGSTTRAAIAAALEYLLDDPRKGRILILEATGNEQLQRRRQQAVRSQATLLTTLTAGFFDHPPPRSDAYLTALSLVGALSELAAAQLDGQLSVPRTRLLDHLSALAIAATHLPPPS
ncbi:MAG TPA: TetR/AcrR family transcriptional regulator [Actinophytocola sp.]|uniref:TetR/AcrR family transcriptional regulator n=1 Tax=Actinophytocola sp. TaxID=1872138 RepID=UPI002DBD0273|nr:TetR/AcrR family transcriptional regulator [Actinophytocola sp.]HEU5475755.1 TetR/AcrR family transcriptional regulator [Actinophytocola sp.]